MITPQYLYIRDHPFADKRGRVTEYRIQAENALGKYLHPKHPVHHHTETQLVICENQIYHKLLHQRTEAYKACGHANWRKCRYCKEYDNPKKLKIHNSGQVYHLSCMREYFRKWKNKNRKHYNEYQRIYQSKRR